MTIPDPFRGRCRCPRPVDRLRAEFTGEELPACPAHHAPAREAEARAQEAEARTEMLRAVAAEARAEADEILGRHRAEPELGPGDFEGRLRKLVGLPPTPLGRSATELAQAAGLPPTTETVTEL